VAILTAAGVVDERDGYDALGRWAGRDPIGERWGVNLCGFVGNDGVDVADLIGLKSFVCSANWDWVVEKGKRVGRRNLFVDARKFYFPGTEGLGTDESLELAIDIAVESAKTAAYIAAIFYHKASAMNTPGTIIKQSSKEGVVWGVPPVDPATIISVGIREKGATMLACLCKEDQSKEDDEHTGGDDGNGSGCESEVISENRSPLDPTPDPVVPDLPEPLKPSDSPPAVPKEKRAPLRRRPSITPTIPGILDPYPPSNRPCDQ
jgi:hypothetical protein